MDNIGNVLPVLGPLGSSSRKQDREDTRPEQNHARRLWGHDRRAEYVFDIPVGIRQPDRHVPAGQGTFGWYPGERGPRGALTDKGRAEDGLVEAGRSLRVVER